MEREILNTVRSESKVKEARDIATNMINSQKAKAYGQASEHEIEESTEEWKREWCKGVATMDLPNSSTQHAYPASHQIPRSTLQHGHVLEETNINTAG